MKLTKTDEQVLNAHSEALEKEQAKKDDVELSDPIPALETNRELLDFFEKGKRKPATSTYFKELDQILGGGLQGGSLYTLGAISSLGKTTFALNIIDQIIHNQYLEEKLYKEQIKELEKQYHQEKGDYQLENDLKKDISKFSQEIIFFSLEMSRQEILSKILSKQTFSHDQSHALTALQIMQNPEGLTDEQKDNLYTCSCNSSSFLNKLFFVEGIGNITTEEIRQYCEKHEQKRGTYPIIFIDYLQMLAPSNDRYTDKQSIDKSVLELKRIARDFDIPVFVISSLNRESYKDEINMTSFKESGAIEYSSDVLLGMQLNGLKEAKQDAKKDNDSLNQKIAELKQGQDGVREIELKILKNRNGIAGSSIHYQYNAKFNHFEEHLKNDHSITNQLPT